MGATIAPMANLVAAPRLYSSTSFGKSGVSAAMSPDSLGNQGFPHVPQRTNTAVGVRRTGGQNGCDLNCGNLYGYIMEAFTEGQLAETDIRTAAVNLMTIQMRLGFFDKNVPFDSIPYDLVDSPGAPGFQL